MRYMLCGLMVALFLSSFPQSAEGSFWCRVMGYRVDRGRNREEKVKRFRELLATAPDKLMIYTETLEDPAGHTNSSHKNFYLAFNDPVLDPEYHKFLTAMKSKYGHIGDEIQKGRALAAEVGKELRLPVGKLAQWWAFKVSASLYGKDLAAQISTREELPVKLGDILSIGCGVCRHQTAVLHSLSREMGLRVEIRTGMATITFGNGKAVKMFHEWMELILADGRRVIMDSIAEPLEEKIFSMQERMSGYPDHGQVVKYKFQEQEVTIEYLSNEDIGFTPTVTIRKATLDDLQQVAVGL